MTSGGTLSHPDIVDVWVLDASSLIEAKSVISIKQQWHSFKQLESMTERGQIAMPRQVINELAEVTHPDLPGAWSVGVRDKLGHPLRPDDEYVRSVTREVPGIVDILKEREDADPYVVALALQLQAAGHAVCVVTEDTQDRVSVSIRTACCQLGIDCCDAKTFLGRCGLLG